MPENTQPRRPWDDKRREHSGADRVDSFARVYGDRVDVRMKEDGFHENEKDVSVRHKAGDVVSLSKPHALDIRRAGKGEWLVDEAPAAKA